MYIILFIETFKKCNYQKNKKQQQEQQEAAPCAYRSGLFHTAPPLAAQIMTASAENEGSLRLCPAKSHGRQESDRRARAIPDKSFW